MKKKLTEAYLENLKMRSPELKLCPFCGKHEAKLKKRFDGYLIECLFF